MNILEMAQKLGARTIDPERAKRVAEKRAMQQESALELRKMLEPLSGHAGRVSGKQGAFHVRSDMQAAYLEFVPDEAFVAHAVIDGRKVQETRYKSGKVVDARWRLNSKKSGYEVFVPGEAMQECSQMDDVMRLVAESVGPLLEE